MSHARDARALVITCDHEDLGGGVGAAIASLPLASDHARSPTSAAVAEVVRLARLTRPEGAGVTACDHIQPHVFQYSSIDSVMNIHYWH